MSAKVTVNVSLKERREKKKDDASLPGAFFLYTLSSFTIIIIFSLSHARNALDLVFSIQLVLRANGMCKGEGGGSVRCIACGLLATATKNAITYVRK